MYALIHATHIAPLKVRICLTTNPMHGLKMHMWCVLRPRHAHRTPTTVHPYGHCVIPAPGLGGGAIDCYLYTLYSFDCHLCVWCKTPHTQMTMALFFPSDVWLLASSFDLTRFETKTTCLSLGNTLVLSPTRCEGQAANL